MVVRIAKIRLFVFRKESSTLGQHEISNSKNLIRFHRNWDELFNFIESHYISWNIEVHWILQSSVISNLHLSLALTTATSIKFIFPTRFEETLIGFNTNILKHVNSGNREWNNKYLNFQFQFNCKKHNIQIRSHRENKHAT